MADSLKERHLQSPLFGPLLDLSAGTSPDQPALDHLRQNGAALLRDHNIRYVVLADDASPSLRDIVLSWGLREVAGDGGRLLFDAR